MCLAKSNLYYRHYISILFAFPISTLYVSRICIMLLWLYLLPVVIIGHLWIPRNQSQIRNQHNQKHICWNFQCNRLTIFSGTRIWMRAVANVCENISAHAIWAIRWAHVKIQIACTGKGFEFESCQRFEIFCNFSCTFYFCLQHAQGSKECIFL